jgi:hypothetical protein
MLQNAAGISCTIDGVSIFYFSKKIHIGGVLLLFYRGSVMTEISAEEYKKIESALDTFCHCCTGCPFDDGKNCFVITIKDLLREHVKEV